MPLPRLLGRAAAFLTTALAGMSPLVAHDHSLPERLGYPADAKLLIIHGDDLGMARAKNLATFDAMHNGVVTSASIMMPTPWVLEVVRHAQAHPELDLGVHLTLTAEWKHYKWGPLAGREHVPSLVDEHGHFHASVDAFAAAAKLDEVEKEIRLQVDAAKAQGIDVTHLDAHMNVLGANDDLKALYLRIGQEYGVPIRMHRHAGDEATDADLQAALRAYPASVDAIYGAPTTTFPDGMIDYYNEVLRNLKPGLNLIVLHVAYDDAETQAITEDHPHWGARWRQIDYDWATSPETKRIIAEEGIILIDHRRLREKLFPVASDAAGE